MEKQQAIGKLWELRRKAEAVFNEIQRDGIADASPGNQGYVALALGSILSNIYVALRHLGVDE